MAVHEGWQGRFFEDFVVGDVYEHSMGRTITTVDNQWFTMLTQNTARIHLDHNYAAHTSFGKPLVNSAFTLALVAGQSVLDVSFNVMANLGWKDVTLPSPVFEGDTVYSRSKVLEARLSRSHPEAGIVTVETTGFNQDGVTVIVFVRSVMVYRRGEGPKLERPPVTEG
ncbi:MAG TPA: MaoC family dehydratase [Acidimicrobiales bacterium]|nr:MaoC family dehydratase [Acidimicrobiales bacterium]